MYRYRFHIYAFYCMHFNLNGQYISPNSQRGPLLKKVKNPCSRNEISVYYHIPRCRNVQLASRMCSETVRIAIWLAWQTSQPTLRPVYRRWWSSKCVRNIHDNSSMVRFQATTNHLNVTVGPYWIPYRSRGLVVIFISSLYILKLLLSAQQIRLMFRSSVGKSATVSLFL
jgi:hypothetical protein